MLPCPHKVAIPNAAGQTRPSNDTVEPGGTSNRRKFTEGRLKIRGRGMVR
jgi:hypothetical protein